MVEGFEQLLEHIGQNPVSGDVDADSVVDILIKLHVGVLTHDVYGPNIGRWVMWWGWGRVRSRIMWELGLL